MTGEKKKGIRRGSSKQASCIAFASHKGGTGKTTSCINIAGWLAKKDKKVLVVDFDPQANASSGVGLDVTSLQSSIYDAVLGLCEGYEGLDLEKVILQTDIENLHIAPSELDLSVAEVIMQQAMDKTFILRRLLEDVSSLYDYILIDLPTSAGLLTINGLCASEHVVIPLDPGIYALEALHNLRKTFEEIEEMSGHTIPQTTVCLTRYKKFNPERHRPSQEIEANLKALFEPVFLIPDSIKIYEAEKEGKPLSHFAPKSRVSAAYEKIAEHIMEKKK